MDLGSQVTPYFRTQEPSRGGKTLDSQAPLKRTDGQSAAGGLAIAVLGCVPSSWINRGGLCESASPPMSAVHPAAAELVYLWRTEQKLVEVLQPRLDAVQNAAADRAPPLQPLRKGLRQALCPVDERETCPSPASISLPSNIPCHSSCQGWFGGEYRERQAPQAFRSCSLVTAQSATLALPPAHSLQPLCPHLLRGKYSQLYPLLRNRRQDLSTTSVGIFQANFSEIFTETLFPIIKEIYDH